LPIMSMPIAHWPLLITGYCSLFIVHGWKIR
jgi:hypothetical protein